MPPQGASYNIDWIISNTSNVHVANDRAWFTSYTPFSTKYSVMPGAKPSADVEGIGTVVLPTRTYLKRKAHKPSCEITLHNVLHAPLNTANMFATRMQPDLNISFFSKAVEPVVRRKDNKVVGLVVPSSSRLCKLWLKGQSQNQSSLDPDGLYYIHASWPDQEIAKYKRHIAESKIEQASKAKQEPPLAREEKEFLKKHYDSEFKLLRTYGLSIHKEDDREEGRRILRALMSDLEDDTIDDSNDCQHSNKGDEFLAGMERDPTSHAADYKFSPDQLNFLKLHYGNATHFMHCYGLKFYDNDDCDEAVNIVKALMDDSEEEDEDDDDQDSDESNDFLAEMEEDPTSHVADYKFSPDQLDLLKKHYGHSGNFMRCCGLKPWDDDDCDEAVSIVKAFMEDPEDDK
ncbi:hypothetical protein E4T49_04881 [Aureobasidium sp. EXF-10728]|nr:hypothetical protein E4T49_04881 [Aureobasidium sp. EXF-10728]